MIPSYRRTAACAACIITIAVSQTAVNSASSSAPAAARPQHSAGFALIRATSVTVPAARLDSLRDSEPRGAARGGRNTIRFDTRAVRFMVTTGPDSDMLSYRIGGQRNPLLSIPRGSVLDVLFVNTDEDMLHNIRFGTMMHPYPNDASSLLSNSVGVKPLPHEARPVYYGARIVLRAEHPGSYAYFCTVRGHAQGGMWGAIEVR